MANEVITQLNEKNQKRLEALARAFGQIRAGRANASLLDRIQVTYYGVPTPLNQIASITIPEARILLVTPFDKTAIKDIEHAISASDLGITPASDGNVIRLVIPQLTEERRKELTKDVRKEAEEAKVSVRNNRRDVLDAAKKQQKASEITEDDLRVLEKEVQEATDQTIKSIDELTDEKGKELLEV